MSVGVFSLCKEGFEIDFYTKRLHFRSQNLEDQDFLEYLKEDEGAMQLYYENWDCLSAFEKMKLWGRDFCVEKRRKEAQEMNPCTALSIEEIGEETVIGQVALDRDEEDRGGAWLSYIIAAHYRGQGYGAEAASAIVRYYIPELNEHFPEKKINELKAHVDLRNEASLRIIRGLGMQLMDFRPVRGVYYLKI